MRRREAISAGGLAALVAALGIRPEDVHENQWVNVPCPGCGLPVAFLPGQKANRCGHCKTGVSRGLVQ